MDRPGLEKRLGPHVRPRLDERLGVKPPARLDRGRGDDQPIAPCVGGAHGAADQPDQVEVQRGDEQVDRRLQPHVVLTLQRRRGPAGLNGPQATLRPGMSGEIILAARSESGAKMLRLCRMLSPRNTPPPWR